MLKKFIISAIQWRFIVKNIEIFFESKNVANLVKNSLFLWWFLQESDKSYFLIIDWDFFAKMDPKLELESAFYEKKRN